MSATIIARCVHGIEWISADEIAQRVADARGLSLARREITFQLPAADAALTELRTADDVFLHVGEVDGVGAGRSEPPAVARRLARLDWRRAMVEVRRVRRLPDRPRFDVVASIEGRRSYNRYAVQDALGAAPVRPEPATGLSARAPPTTRSPATPFLRRLLDAAADRSTLPANSPTTRQDVGQVWRTGAGLPAESAL